MAAATVRPLEERDVDRAGDVNFVAFYDVAVRHGMRPVVTTPSEARSYLRHLLAFDPLGGLVAEQDGDVVGMAWVHPRGPVATIGPVAVDPRYQGRGIGRLLVERSLELAGPRAPQVRLVHESFNPTSLALYLRTGFRVVAPLCEFELAAGSRVVAASPTGVKLRVAAAGRQRRGRRASTSISGAGVSWSPSAAPRSRAMPSASPSGRSDTWVPPPQTTRPSCLNCSQRRRRSWAVA